MAVPGADLHGEETVGQSELFCDRNSAANTLFALSSAPACLPPLALLALYLQNLMGSPILTAGLVIAPRGSYL